MEEAVIDAFQDEVAKRMELKVIEIQEEVVVIDLSESSLEEESMAYFLAKY